MSRSDVKLRPLKRANGAEIRLLVHLMAAAARLLDAHDARAGLMIDLGHVAHGLPQLVDPKPECFSEFHGYKANLN